MRTIASWSSVRLLTIYKREPNCSVCLYPALLTTLERWLEAEHGYGIVWFDGVADSLEVGLRKAHRDLLYSRRVVEDAVPRRSEHSHFIQVADMVVYSAFKSIQWDAGTERRDRIGGFYSTVRDLTVDLDGRRNIGGYNPKKQ